LQAGLEMREQDMDFDGLVDRYSKPIYNLIYRLLGDADEAADLTQETFIRAFRSFSKFRGEASVYTWLYRIAVNLCKNRFRHKDGAGRYEGPSLDEAGPGDGTSTLADTVAHHDTPDAVLQRKELRDRIEQAIGELPYDYRIVAVLRDLHGLSYQQIAEATGLSVDVVRTRLARAREMLRRKLKAYLDE